MKVGYTLITLTYAKFGVDLYMWLQLTLSGVCFLWDCVFHLHKLEPKYLQQTLFQK